MRFARYNFNPCEFQERLYICGGDGALDVSTSEVFLPESCEFRLLHAHLPDSSSQIGFVVDELLVVLSEKYVTKWKIGENDELVEVARAIHPSIRCCSPDMAPVVDSENSRVFYSESGVCYRISLETYTQHQVD